MLRILYISIILVFGYTNVQAQGITLNGYLRDSTNHSPIIGGTVMNATTGKSVKTNELGFFRLPVTYNDRLYAVATAYHFDTLTYSPLFVDTVTIYLSPSGAMLPGVTVTSQFSKYQLDSMQRKAAFDAARGPEMHTVANPTSSAFGMNINLDRFFKKKYKNQRRQEHTFGKTEEALYVHSRFSPEMVSSYTGLTGEELRVFLLRYTPSYIWLREHPTDAEIMYYLNDKLKEFRASPGAKKSAR